MGCGYVPGLRITCDSPLNMKSVVVRSDLDGRPVGQRDYAAFMGCVGFRARLCRPRHPFTKGKVERLIRFVKGNFLADRDFTDITALNEDALLWCTEQVGRWRREVACVPSDEHEVACRPDTRARGDRRGGSLTLPLLQGLTVTIKDVIYNNKVQTPPSTVKEGSATLTKGTDYLPSYAAGRKSVGSFKVTVKGKAAIPEAKRSPSRSIPRGRRF